MAWLVEKRTIQAPIDDVFKAIATVDEFAKAVPQITSVEFVSEKKYGVGTRFKETRIIAGKEATTELEVTELIDNEKIRIVSDTNGTVWDSVFTVNQHDQDTVLTLEMDANAYKLIPRLINPIIKGMVKKALQDDMDAIKAFCEK